MAQKSVPSSVELGKAMKARRLDLGLTIASAASAAGVGIKTWCRYEAGEAIRADKVKGVCKALHWRSISNVPEEQNKVLQAEEYRKKQDWPLGLEEQYGFAVARAFYVGSEILWENIHEDLAQLKRLPAETHLGQIAVSFLADELPEQFVTRYDYDFLYALKCNLRYLKEKAMQSEGLTPDNVAEELLLHLIAQEAGLFFKEMNGVSEEGENWVNDVIGNRDVVSFLFEDMYVLADHSYHFDHWFEEQYVYD